MSLRNIKDRHFLLILLAGFVTFILVLSGVFIYILDFGTKDAIQTSISVISLVTAIGLLLAWRQIKLSEELHQTQFEDSLSREYRELMQKIPVKVFLDDEPDKDELDKYEESLFHYLTLSNDQIFLRMKGRVNTDTWNDWKDGIKSNMELKAFQNLWDKIEKKSQKDKSKMKTFRELRQLINDEYKTDPIKWQQ